MIPFGVSGIFVSDDCNTSDFSARFEKVSNFFFGGGIVDIFDIN